MMKNIIDGQVQPVVRWINSSFGEFADLELPNGTTAIILCIDRFSHQPRFLRLSHQVYRDELKELISKEPGIESFTIFPIRNNEAITIPINSI